MSRQLFIHHYLPSLYFSILLLALLFDLVTSALRPRFRLAAATAAVLMALLVYLEFSPLTYAGPWTLQRCERARWLKSWDFNCREFPTSLADYKTLPPGVHKAGTTTPVPVEGFKGDAAVGGEITEAAAEMAMGMAQPGQHAFEEVPRPAMHSGAGGGAGQQQVVEQVQAAPAEAAAPPEPAAPVVEDAADAPFSIQPVAGIPGDGHVQQHAPAPAHADDAQAAAQAAAAHHAAVGMDQEHVEAMVLEGTAGVAGGAQHRQEEQQKEANEQGLRPSAPAPSRPENEVPPV